VQAHNLVEINEKNLLWLFIRWIKIDLLKYWKGF